MKNAIHPREHAGRTESPSIPDYGGSLNSSTAALAADFQFRAEALRRTQPEVAGWFHRAAVLLQLCAVSSAEQRGWRCGQPVCPRCEARKAIRYRKRMEARLRKPEAGFGHVTATLATDDLECGALILKPCFAALRRSDVWRGAIAGGEAHIHAKAAERGSARAFNLHLHAVVELRAGAALDSVALDARWRGLLAARGAVGSLLAQHVTKHWGVFQGWRHG